MMPVAPRITLLTRLALPPRTVFALLTEPAHVRSWWGGTGGRVLHVQMVPRGGEDFWVAVLVDGKRGYDNHGCFTQVVPGEVLAADWQHDGSVSHLVIQLLQLGEETEITLTHRDFPDLASRDFQLERWQAALAALRHYAAGLDAQGVPIRP